MSHKRLSALNPFSHKKKNSSELEEDLRNLNLGEAGPATPHRRWSFGRSHGHGEVPGAPAPSREQHLAGTEAGSRLARHSPSEVLLELLAPCEPNTKFSARLNKVAEKEGYHYIQSETRPWALTTLENGQSFEKSFVQAVTRYDAQVKAGKISKWKTVEYFPQVEKLLVLEGDVGDSVLTNVLNPLVDIFNLFIHPDYQGRLQCVIRSQHDAQSSKLDHASDRNLVFTETLPPLGQDYELQVPLCIIEEKAPGIVREQDWTQNRPDSWSAKLLPQLFLYAHRAGCSRFFLTNYTESIAMRIDLTDLESAVRDLEANRRRACNILVQVQARSSAREFSKDSDDKLPSDYGSRMGIASEVYLALLDLGVVDLELIDAQMKGKAPTKINDEIANYLQRPLPRPRRDSSSPSAGRERLPYSAPPPSP
ncbi:hypothetical protein JCM16303_007068 [Sporobolomyces ruberrimus]